MNVLRTIRGMRGVRRTACTLLVAVTLVATQALPAWAPDGGGGCGTRLDRDGNPILYTTAAQCHFVFRGLPIVVTGDAQVLTGDATVRVWATIMELEDRGVAPVLVECTATARGFAQCTKGVPDEVTVIENLALGQAYVSCHVRSTTGARGTYRCISGSGR